MNFSISAFIPIERDFINYKNILGHLISSPTIENIYLLAEEPLPFFYPKCETLLVKNLFSSETILKIIDNSTNQYTLLLLDDADIDFGPFLFERFVQFAYQNNAGLVYSDYYEVDEENEIFSHPVIDYQLGSLRDDFDFGKIVLMDSILLNYLKPKLGTDLEYSAFYELRLLISESKLIKRIPEYLYTSSNPNSKDSDIGQFAYVDPQNRDLQIEREKVVTKHLKAINAYKDSEPIAPDLNSEQFDVEASVIIPVKNRVNTISDAIESVLNQKTNFDFNLIIVDNHSKDGTSDIIREFTDKDDKIMHLIPSSLGLGIGGCWNIAIHHEKAGKFIVQLDSDDIYSDENTLHKIVNKFYEENCAMIVGSYKLTDFDLNEIPPGIIDHREWTDKNGRNNVLRINGLGAPRAFYAPVIRKINFPNVSYGEDYFVLLTITRDYRIGRIYDPIYICRRWEGNTDSNITLEIANKYNYYKDGLRTTEINLRQMENN